LRHCAWISGYCGSAPIAGALSIGNKIINKWIDLGMMVICPPA
jgi:hypothetical protein